jgi:hypothetical protein
MSSDLACADPQRLAERHVALGGQLLSVFPSWLAMADPIGRQYCLTTRSPETGGQPGTKTA